MDGETNDDAARDRELVTLREGARLLGGHYDLTALLDRAFTHLRYVADYTSATVLVAEDGALVVLGQATPNGWPGPGGVRLIRPSNDRLTPIWNTIAQGRPVIIADVHDDSPHARNYRATAARHGLTVVARGSVLCAPLPIEDEVIGMSALSHHTPGDAPWHPLSRNIAIG